MRPFSAWRTVDAALLERRLEGEDVAHVVVDDEHLDAGERRVRREAAGSAAVRCRLRPSLAVVASVASAPAYRAGRWSVKVLPSPGALTTSIDPPSSRAISRLIVRPRPVPPYLRLVVPSACWNASKMSCCFSTGMPMPVSRTANARTPSPCSRAARWTRQRHAAAGGELEGVREQVLQDLLQPVDVAEDRRRQLARPSRISKSSSFCVARRAGTSARGSRAPRASAKVCGSIGILPASTFERSRISLMSCRRSLPDV